LKHVLLIDDDADLREMLAHCLSDAGYEVALARNGLEGLRLACEHRPSIILLDLMMPRMDGWEFRAAQKQDAALAGIPVVAISASGERLSDASIHFSKPFDVVALVDAIEQYAVET
jgi:CheY-like chemotaxis protein